MSPPVAIPTAKLNTGAEIPLLGYGTYQMTSSDAVKCAIDVGYRHIDGAHFYANEEVVGEGIQKSGIDRKELFVVTKVWNDRKDDVLGSLNESLAKLQTDYVDLLLLHWPNTFSKEGSWEMGEGTPLAKGSEPKGTTFHDAWRQMSEIFKEGKKVKAIGVSNFSEKTLEELFTQAGPDVIIPAVNQVEMSPDLPQHSLRAYCERKDIHLTAWSPLGGIGSNLTTDPLIEKMAKDHGEGTSTGQILISWGVARGTSVIPKSSTPSRIHQNAALISLSSSETALLDAKHRAAENPKRLARGEAKTKKIMEWTYEEMGWEDREDL